MAGQVWIKQGVQGELCREMRRAVGLLAKLYGAAGEDLFITSAQEGNHTAGSLHYDGRAVDFRKGSIQLGQIQLQLPSGYDLVEELSHYHLEWDPR